MSIYGTPLSGMRGLLIRLARQETETRGLVVLTI